MGGIAVIGETTRVAALGLAGVLVVPAEDPEQVLAAWESLPDDVTLVLLTPAAARQPRPAAGRDVLTAVMPP